MGKQFELDLISQQFQAEAEALVSKYAKGDAVEWAKRWKQLSTWGMTRSQGDVVKKAALKKRLMSDTGGK